MVSHHNIAAIWVAFFSKGQRLAHAAIAEDGSDLSVEDRTAAEVEGGVADSGRGGLVAGDGGAVAVAQLDLVLRDSEVSRQRAKRSQGEAEAEPEADRLRRS